MIGNERTVPDRPDVAVVVVTYNSAAVVGDLLDSLPAGLAGLRAEVVVVDNGSTDGTVALLRARGDCRVVMSANVGYAGGINRGAREVAAGVPLLVLNPDVRVEPGSVPPLLAALARPGTGVVAPRVTNPDGSLHRSLRREPSILRAIGLNFTGRPVFSEYVTAEADYARPGVVDWALGAALLVGRDCFDALGGWDESYFLYSEETDFSLRARDRGWVTRYEPASVVMHIGGASGRNDTTHVMQIVNRVRLYRRRHGAARAWVYWAATVASECSWIVRAHPQSRAAVVALLRPSRRPAQMGASGRVLPA